MFTLSQTCEAIKDKPEFSLKDKGTYSVVDYNLSMRDTFVGKTEFETMILLNLRGTAFDNESGEIIRLGYHKFFNYGEYPDADQLLCFNDAHVITQKLDGSCIFPIYAQEGILLGTRAGVTDISILASDFAMQTTNYVDLIAWCSSACNATPIFEFCSRKNRVVLDYPEDQLVLTGVRYMDTGVYMAYKNVITLGKEYNVPVVLQFRSIDKNTFNYMRSEISKLTNDEGIVIRFESGNNAGHMIKIKSEEYVLKHKTLDGLKFAKDVALLSLNSLLDDIYPILDESTATRVRNFSDDLQSSLTRFIQTLLLNSKYVKFLFAMLDGKDAEKFVIDFAKKQCGNQVDCTDLQKFFGMTVTY